MAKRPLVVVLMSDGSALLVAVPLNAPPPTAQWIAEQRRLAGRAA